MGEQKKGRLDSIPGDEGRITQAWVNVRGGLRVFSVYFWHSEGWTPRNEALLDAVLRQAKVTRHPWLVACDANMCPEDFEKSLWFQRELMHVVAPREASTCRSKNSKGEWIERIYDYVIASGSLKGNLHRWRWWKALSRDHTKQCPLWSRKREKEVQEWNEQKLPKVLPGYSGGRLPGRRAKERGREDEEEEENGRERKVRYETAQEVVAGIKEKAVVHEDAKSTAQRTVRQSDKQSWDCSQIENEEEEEAEEEEVCQKEHPMEWRWAEDEKLEEILEQRRMERYSLQAEVMQKGSEWCMHERKSHKAKE